MNNITRVLVLNSGSSSIKFCVLDVEHSLSTGVKVDIACLLKGTVKGIGGPGALELKIQGKAQAIDINLAPDHHRAFDSLFECLKQESQKDNLPITLSSIDCVGHRVVHGGDRFFQSALITDTVKKEINDLSELAPLHNPACVEGIQSTQKNLGKNFPMVAVFDTAFHRTMPPVAKTYALPHDLTARHDIQRYGFHGIAHASLLEGYLFYTGRRREQEKVITLQLGNGCSATAIANGRSIDTSMGFTPLEGLVMGTRSGDLDPSLVDYLSKKEKVDPKEVVRWLNEESGLFGMSGRTNDMRELLRAAEKENDSHAKLAIELFCYRAKKYIGSYLAILGGANAIVFGGGIGEASPDIRARICQGFEWCGLEMDTDKNLAAVGLSPGEGASITKEGSSLEAFVIPADEETWIAKETVRCLQSGNRS